MHFFQKRCMRKSQCSLRRTYPYRDENACPDRTYVVSELCTYTSRDGIWRLEQTIATQKNQKLGALLKAIDCAMRESYHYRYA